MQQDLITVYGIPAHPLVVHAVVVLLPLATLGGLVIALRASWRRRFGLAVLLVAAAGIGAVPAAKLTGEQLQAALQAGLPPGQQLDPAVQTHAALGDDLLPFALVFGVALLLLLIAGRLADRERGAAQSAEADAQVTTTWRRVAVVAAALVAFTGVAATVQVVRIGHSGSAAVWQGVGGG
jgi:hypothetical protein